MTCPVVSELTAGGSFDLDALAEHVKTCAICQGILTGLSTAVADGLSAAAPSAAGRLWRVELAADAASNPAAEVLAASEHDAWHHDPEHSPIDGGDRLIVYTTAPTLTAAIDAARLQVSLQAPR